MGYLFLSGNQRSGKTLLQLMLSSHPEISISPGTNVIAKLLYESPRGVPLDAKRMRTFRQTLQKDRKLKAWRVDHRVYQQMVAGYTSITSRQAVEDLMRFFRDQTKPGARYIGNKKGCYCKEGDLVKRVFPEAKLVFILRDGRGAVSSMLETQPEHDIYSASLTWMMKARRIRELQAMFPHDCFVVRYESLVRDPERTSRELCRFLGLDFAPEMLADYRHNDAIRHATDTTHAETYQDITTSMIDEWKTHLRPDQIDLVEGITGKELVAHGYRLERTTPRSPIERAKLRWLRTREYSEWWLSHTRKSRAIG
jgi:hypothetical protein